LYLCVNKCKENGEKKEWREGEMILTFQLTKIDTTYTPLMRKWIGVPAPTFTAMEQHNFDMTYLRGLKKNQNLE
jgi:hypothetical protein